MTDDFTPTVEEILTLDARKAISESHRITMVSLFASIFQRSQKSADATM